MKNLTNHLCLIGAILWAILAIPSIQQELESTMTSQMLLQIPLLVLAGWWFAHGTPDWVNMGLSKWDQNGINGLLLASLTSIVWMLPIALDSALNDVWITIAKFLSVPLLIGAPIALSWPRAGFVVRGIVLVELIATALRLGWLYLISPDRLCTNYLLDDQLRLGKYLLVIGSAIFLILIWKLLWGSINIPISPIKNKKI